MHVELASTAMVGLSEGAEYLITYPYGCAEQRGSAAFALMLASDLGDSFKLQGIDAPTAHKIAQTTLVDLEKYQCGDGGFAYWAGECQGESPYLTSYLLHVFQRAQKLGYNVDADMVGRAYTYLDKSLEAKRPTNEGWYPSYTAWQAFRGEGAGRGWTQRRQPPHAVDDLHRSDAALRPLVSGRRHDREEGRRGRASRKSIGGC